MRKLILILMLMSTAAYGFHSALRGLLAPAVVVADETVKLREYYFPNIGTNFFTPDTGVYEVDGNINKGTANEPSWVGPTTNGLDIGCYEFDGTSDYIGIYTNGFTTNGVTGGTFSCWVNFNSNQDQYLLCAKTTSSPWIGVSFIDDKVGVAAVYDAEGLTWWTVTSDTILSTGVWYQVGFTADGDEYKLFVNGTNTSATVYAANPGLWIGKWEQHPSGYHLSTVDLGRRWDSSKWVDGYMAFPALYNEVLSTGDYYNAYSTQKTELGL